jgi:hypothetical protein
MKQRISKNSNHVIIVPIEFTTKNDSLLLTIITFIYYIVCELKENESKRQSRFYLDRAIYRPGQQFTIKNFLKEQDKTSIVAKRLSKLQLRLNGSVFKEFDVLRNEWIFLRRIFCT